MNHQRDAAAPAEPLGLGVRYNPNRQYYVIEIRPQRWKNGYRASKFWMGKIERLPIRDLGFARYVADAIFYYCGKERCHYENENFVFPPLESLDRPTPEERSNYVQAIAGSGFHNERKKFIKEVKEVLERPDFILQGKRFLGIAPPADEEVAPVPPPPADEVAPVPAPPADEAAPVDEGAADSSYLEECETGLEEDVDGVAMYARFASSSQGPSIAAFGLNFGRAVDKRILESEAQLLGFERYNPNDCPSFEDKDWPIAIKDWDMATKELDKKSAVADPQLVVSSPNAVDIAAPVFGNISFVPGTNFVVLG